MLPTSMKRRAFSWTASFPQSALTIAATALLMIVFTPVLSVQAHSIQADTPAVEAVSLMVKHEIHDHRNEQASHAFRFLSIERSARTGGHLWTEEVVEVDGGLLRRLIAVDGKPLTPAQQAAEQRRLDQLAADPSEFARQNHSREKDEARVVKLLERMPKEYLFQYDGEENGCRRIAFRPNPAYQSVSFADRVISNMAGTMDIEEPSMRLCSVHAHLVKNVNFGFGLLGHLSEGSGFSLGRSQVVPSVWRSTMLQMHFDGAILFFRSISRSQHTIRREFQPIPTHINLKQAVVLSQPATLP